MSSAEANHSRLLISRGVVHAFAAARAGRGARVDGGGEQCPAASLVRGDVKIGEGWPLVELEDEQLAGGQERPVPGGVGHPGGGERGLDRGPADEVDQGGDA